MKKIMFNDKHGLTQAVLDGRKTMTRRIVPQCVLNKVTEYQERYYAGALESISEEDAILNMIGPERMFGNFPRVGEIVAIAQSYRTISRRDDLPVMLQGDKLEDGSFAIVNSKDTAGWNNKMFVRPEHMPHTILMTSLRVEHLQDISDEDCLREGIMEGKFMNTWDRYYFDSRGDVLNHITFRTPREAFAGLIDKVSKRGTWDSNPLVLAYELKLVK